MAVNLFKFAKTHKDLKKSTDDELMSLIGTGSSKAFQELFNRHSSLALGFSKKILGDLQRAEEASQELWVKVVRLAPLYQKKGHFKAWMMTMLKNHCLNILRKDSRLSFHEDMTEVSEAQSLEHFEEGFFNQFDLQEVSKAIDTLPEKQRIAITLLITEELTYEEIAAEMDVGLGALKSMIHRARKTLQMKLKEEAGFL